MLVPFILLRLLDIISTSLVLCVDPTLEANPLQATIQRLGLPAFAVINLTISLLAYYLISKLPERISKPTLIGFMVLNTFVVCVNIFVLCRV
jgi:hypothetical protein